jgi:DNA-binding GntR family transcriptional regulator
MKTDTVYKRAYNQALQLLAKLGKGAAVPSENELSEALGVSRTTVRKVLDSFDRKGVTSGEPRRRLVRIKNPASKRYPQVETIASSDQVERHFMEWMLRDNTNAGTSINELDLARKFGVATSGIRGFLNRFQRFGLIEKRPKGGWIFRGFTREFALELFEIREIFEMRAARAFARLNPQSLLWSELSELKSQHEALLEDFDRRYLDFSDLDRRFHALINRAAPNRFVQDFYDIVALVFHYHYQWNKRDERQRNEAAIKEHLRYIAALLSRSVALSEKACRAHLRSARTTLLRSTA